MLSIKFLPIQIFYLFSTKKFLRSKLLNKFGIQHFRIKYSDKILQKRRKKFNSLPKRQNWISALEENGLVVVPNVLSSKEIVYAKKTLDKYTSKFGHGTNNIMHKELIGSGTTFSHIPFTEFKEELENIFKNHFYAVEDTVSHYLGNGVTSKWFVKVVKDNDETKTPAGDTNCHSDTFHNTLKAWIYLD